MQTVGVSLVLALTQTPVLLTSSIEPKHWIYTLVCIIVLPPVVAKLLSIRISSAVRVFAIVLVAYVGLHLIYECLVYYTGLQAREDTAAFVQCFWNFLRDGSFSTTIDGQYSGVAPDALNHFARHNSPILFLAVIPFAVHQEMITLLVLKAFLLALTGWLAFKYVCEAIPGSKGTVAAALLPYALMLQIPLLLLTDFAEAIFYPPLILWSALAFRLQKRWQFVISCVLLAMVKETSIPILLIWSAVAVIRKRERLYVLLPAVLSILLFVVSFFWVIPHFNRGNPSPFLSDIPVAWHGLNVATIASYVFQTMNLWGWLPLASPVSLLAVPDLIVNSFFSAPMPMLVEFIGRYQLAIACSMFVGAVDSLPWIGNLLERRPKFRKAKHALIVYLLSLSVIGLFRAGTPLHYLWDHLQKDWSRDVKCLELVAQSNEPVISHTTLSGYFAKRHEVWTTGGPVPETLFARAVWYVAREDPRHIIPAFAGWDTVCVGATIIVLKRPDGRAPVGASRIGP